MAPRPFRRRWTPETLEDRRLMDSGGLSAGGGSGGEVAAVAALPERVEPLFCRLPSFAAPLGPAPFLSDRNLDGLFGSEDLIAIYSETGANGTFGSNPAGGVDEVADVIESMQILGYETGVSIDEALSCSNTVQSRQWSANQIHSQVTYHADGRTVREAITSFGDATQPRYRSIQRYDNKGALQSLATEVYAADTDRLYTRTQTEFSPAGTQISHSTMLFDSSGQRRRLTATMLYPDSSHISRASDVQEFDARGVLVSREFHFFNVEGKEVGVQIYAISNGVASTLTSYTINERGQMIRTGTSPAPRDGDARFPLGFTQSAYLLQVKDATQQLWQSLKPRYAEILRMRALPAQANLNALITQAGVNSTDATRLRNLQYYFDLVVDLAKGAQAGDMSFVFTKYSRAIDSASGDWSPWMKSLVSTEKLTLPPVPVRLPFPTDSSGISQSTQVNTYWTMYGANPHQALFSRYLPGESQIPAMQASMRKVMANIKVLEYRRLNGPPLFDWTVVEDDSDFRRVGMQQIVPLTSWHFFRLVNGQYQTNEVDENIIRERVAELTDTNVFYVMNIEYWDLEEPGNLNMTNLLKLKRAADLVHKYNPNLLVGYYRMLPERNVMAAYQDPGSDAYKEWQAHNDYIAATLAPSLDLIFPSLYTVHLGEENLSTEERWKIVATETVNEAKRVAEGKPVIPFLMLYYHRNGLDPVTGRPKNPKGMEWVEPELLLYQLLLLDALADGTVIYNDRFLSRQGMIDTQLFGAVERFFKARNTNGEAALRAKYDQLLSTYRVPLHDKLELEKRLRYAIYDRSDALVRGDTQAAARFATEINSLQTRIASAIDLWDLLRV